MTKYEECSSAKIYRKRSNQFLTVKKSANALLEQDPHDTNSAYYILLLFSVLGYLGRLFLLVPQVWFKWES